MFLKSFIWGPCITLVNHRILNFPNQSTSCYVFHRLSLTAVQRDVHVNEDKTIVLALSRINISVNACNRNYFMIRSQELPFWNPTYDSVVDHDAMISRGHFEIG